jgi:hypothetical protein
VRCPTAKKALPCETTTTHGKPTTHGKGFDKRTAKKLAWQRDRLTHGKDSTHGKKRSKRTAKTHVFAVTKHFAMRHDFMHDKGSFVVRCTLCSFSHLSISRFGSCFTKKHYFGNPKMGKARFVGRKENRPPWRSSPSKGYARIRYGLVPINYAMLMAESSSFNLKAMQP